VSRVGPALRLLLKSIYLSRSMECVAVRMRLVAQEAFVILDMQEGGRGN
jgi:hypothetical protein